MSRIGITLRYFNTWYEENKTNSHELSRVALLFSDEPIFAFRSKNLEIIINNAKNLPNLKEFRLKNYSDSTLPENIGELRNLRRLILAGNTLKTIPDSIGNLTKLESLDLALNNLTSLPESIGNLRHLKELRSSFNQLTSLPDSIGNLRDLEILNAHNNQITTLPQSMENFIDNGVYVNLEYNPLNEEAQDLLARIQNSYNNDDGNDYEVNAVNEDPENPPNIREPQLLEENNHENNTNNSNNPSLEGGRRQSRRHTKKTKKVVYRGLKHAKKTRKPMRKPKKRAQKSCTQKKSKKQLRKTKRKQRGGNIFFDANKIPEDAIYTGYNPSVEGMYTTEVRSNFKKDLEDDSMDTLSAQGI